MVRLLKQKEEHNDSVSFCNIVKYHGKLCGFDSLERLRKQWDKIISCLPLVRNYFIFKYEDFITNNLNNLSQYLGFDVSADATIEDQYKYVVRTKSSGDWKNWFLPEDVHFFYPLFHQFIDKYDYPRD